MYDLMLAVRVALIVAGMACLGVTGVLLAHTTDELQRGRSWAAAIVSIGAIESASQRIAGSDHYFTLGTPIVTIGLVVWTWTAASAIRRIRKRGTSDQ